jgi:hypothetical protein
MAGFGLPINFYIKQNVQNPGDSFVGTISVNGTIYDTNDGTGDKYTYSSNPLSSSTYIYLDGVGIKKVKILIIGEGGDGGNSSANSSGAGGAGGEIKYYTEYELTGGYYYFSVGRQGILDDPITGFKKGNSNTSDPANFESPFDISCIKGGGAAGGISVSGMSNGNDGTAGLTSSITGTDITYGWGGGSGACVNSSQLNQVISKSGGIGLPGVPPAGDDGDGQLGSRYSNNIINSFGCGKNGTSTPDYGFGHGGGGASAVYAKSNTFPNAYQWFTKSDCGVNGKGQGGNGGIIIRWTP